jgi:hypothetical protein
MSKLWYKEQAVPDKTHEASFVTGTNIQIYVSLSLLVKIITKQYYNC